MWKYRAVPPQTCAGEDRRASGDGKSDPKSGVDQERRRGQGKEANVDGGKGGPKEAARSAETTPARLALVGQGIEDIAAIPGYLGGLAASLVDLNLHANQLTSISGLSSLVRLRFLNLSSNYIEIMAEAELGALECLEVLNLSSNLVRRVGGLENLKSLKKINLSYNKIESLEGLKRVVSDKHSLENLDLRDNRLKSVRELETLLCCNKLVELKLRGKASTLNGKRREGNSICNAPEYPAILCRMPACLTSVDGEERNTYVAQLLSRCPPTEDQQVLPAARQQSQHAVRKQCHGNRDGVQIENSMPLPTPDEDYENPWGRVKQHMRAGRKSRVAWAQAPPHEGPASRRLGSKTPAIDRALMRMRSKQFKRKSKNGASADRSLRPSSSILEMSARKRAGLAASSCGVIRRCL